MRIVMGNTVLTMVRVSVLILCAALGFGLAQAQEEAPNTGVVTGGKIQPINIAVTPFLAGSGSEDVAASIAGVITNNLGRSGYFNPLPPESFIEQVSDFEQAPNMSSWRQVQARAVVTGQAYMDGPKLRVAFKLFDVNSGQMLASQSLAASPKLARRLRTGFRIRSTRR